LLLLASFVGAQVQPPPARWRAIRSLTSRSCSGWCLWWKVGA